jgi:hypothetical protein
LLGLLLTDGESECATLSLVLLGFKRIVGDEVGITLGFEDTVGACVFNPLLGLLLPDGESVCDALASPYNTLGFIETLGFPVLLGLKLIDGNAVGITLGFEDTVGDLVFTPPLGLLLTDGEFICAILSLVLLGFKLIVGGAVYIALGFEDTVGACVFTPLLGLLLTDGESVCDALVSPDNTLGFIETLGFSVLLGFKLIVGDTVGSALGFEDIIGA